MSVKMLPVEGSRNVQAVLEVAKEQELDSVLVLGWKDDAFYYHTSDEYMKDVLWNLEVLKSVIME